MRIAKNLQLCVRKTRTPIPRTLSIRSLPRLAVRRKPAGKPGAPQAEGRMTAPWLHWLALGVIVLGAVRW